MKELLLAGRCFCGAVRYQCAAPLYPATVCHCESCRRVAGSHAVAWLTVPSGSFVHLAAEPAQFSSSPHVHRTFCRECGTPLSYRHAARPDEIDVMLATLERAADFAPIDHIWMEDALPWDRPRDGLPQYPKTRAGAALGAS